MAKFTTSLARIQRTLKAPKGNYNSFGKYKYRSCEDILEAVKPLLADEEMTLVVSDDVIEIAGRVYIKATATLSNGESEISVTALAREPETKKGMDDSQVTGTASSYARKYALNGLFCIDDTKDPDTDEYKKQTANRAEERDTAERPSEKITEKQARDITELAEMAGRNAKAMCEYYGIDRMEDMTVKQYADAFRLLNSALNKNMSEVRA